MTGGDTVSVAVGKQVEESRLTLLWTIQNFCPKKVCILHVHQPDEAIALLAGALPTSRLDQNELRSIQEVGKQIMHRILDDYLDICQQAGVRGEKVHIEMEDIAKGILELSHKHNIKKLVMGAAADKHYTEGMTDLKSEKALYVCQYLPLSCQIWFICGGNLVHTRSIIETGLANPRISSPGPSNLTCPIEIAGDSDLTVYEATAESTCGLGSYVLLHSGEDLDFLPMPNEREGSSSDQFYDQYEQALSEAEKSRKELMEEYMKRMKAEKDVIHALRQAREFERRYSEELRRRREMEAALVEHKENFEKIKQQRVEENLDSLDQQLLWDSQVANLRRELEDMMSTLEQFEICKKERDQLLLDLDSAHKITEELLGHQEESSSMHMQSEFSVSDIHEATDESNPSLIIGEGPHGVVYKGYLCHTTVAIKVLPTNSLQGPSKFQQEVDVLSKLRHPNLVTLIGACPELWALIFEYLPNGSLEDRLHCRSNTPPLPWQTRIRIATEICTVLIFLHSSNPQSIVHGNLKPGNILLDASFGCKISDIGAFRTLSILENSRNMSDPNRAYPYVDPQFLTTERLFPSSDIYSFGIILLQLLTGRSPSGIAEQVQDALNAGNLSALLDPSAGSWPYVQAAQLTHLALRCCDINPSRRPDLASEVLKVLEPIRASCGTPSPFLVDSEENHDPPSYFICPILQEVMRDPQVAADGFTYEAEALLGWLESGHDTSPMTNERLAHCNLVPNHALRSAIQEWMQQH